jgi:hypothetical protein
MLREYEDLIVAGMVKKGYVVSIVAVDGQLTAGQPGRPSVVTTFRVDTGKEGLQAKDIHKDLIDVLHEKNMLYYSVIVSAYVDACWMASNITFPKPPEPPPAPQPPIPVPEPDKNLN